MCIGSSFAMQGLKVILALVLQRHRLEFVSGTCVDRQFKRGAGGVHGNIRNMVKLPE